MSPLTVVTLSSAFRFHLCLVVALQKMWMKKQRKQRTFTLGFLKAHWCESKTCARRKFAPQRLQTCENAWIKNFHGQNSHQKHVFVHFPLHISPFSWSRVYLFIALVYLVTAPKWKWTLQGSKKLQVRKLTIFLNLAEVLGKRPDHRTNSLIWFQSDTFQHFSQFLIYPENIGNPLSSSHLSKPTQLAAASTGPTYFTAGLHQRIPSAARAKPKASRLTLLTSSFPLAN